MKKQLSLIIVAVVAVIAISALATALFNHSNGTTPIDAPDTLANLTPSQRFVEEHESLNNILDEDGHLRHLNITLPVYNTIQYLSFDDLTELLTTGTGILFFSRPTGPWCRILLPTLLQVAIEEDITLHYFDPSPDRAENNYRYQALLSRLHNYLPVDDRDQTPGTPGFDENRRRITLPHVFVIQNGEIIDHVIFNRHLLLQDAQNLSPLADFLRDLFSPLTTQ